MINVEYKENNIMPVKSAASFQACMLTVLKKKDLKSTKNYSLTVACVTDADAASTESLNCVRRYNSRARRSASVVSHALFLQEYKNHHIETFEDETIAHAS